MIAALRGKKTKRRKVTVVYVYSVSVGCFFQNRERSCCLQPFVAEGLINKWWQLHGPTMFAVKAKIYGVPYNQSSSIAFDETSSYWSAPKSFNFSAFHWSPHGSLVSIGQHFVATRIVHLPKRTEISLITESDQRASNHQLCSYAPPAQPGPIRTRLCGPCIAAIAGSVTFTKLNKLDTQTC